jgi:Ca2+:H+ antiporter
VVIFSSWINWLLVFVPVGIVLGALHKSLGEESPVSPTIVFAINAIAIIPLASLLSFATESVAKQLGDKIGALMNVTFGNAVELIILYACIPWLLFL